MRSLRDALLLTTGLMLALLGCPRGSGETTLPVVTSDNPAAEAALAEAEAAEADGNTPEALTRYRAFIRDYPTDPLVAMAHLHIGRLLVAEGNLVEARAELAHVREHDEPAVADRALLYEAVAMHLQGESEGAIAQLRPLVNRTVTPDETVLLFQTIAAAASRLGRKDDALEAYDALARSDVPAVVREEARTRIDDLTNEIDAEQVDDLFTRLPRSGYAWPSIARRALREAFARGDLGRVRVVAASLEEERVTLDRELQSIALRAERTGRTDPGAIGAILPLSGRGQEVGQLALQALMLAAGLPPDRPPTENTPRVFHRDSGGDPERAARAVDDLVTLHQVVAIVGPIEGRSSRAAARRAEELGVPILTLSPDPHIVQEGQNVFRLFPSPADEASALVEQALASGARRFAAFRPDHGYGETMTSAFRAAVTEQGGEWVGEVRYPPSSTSLGEVLEGLDALRPDALFVPDHARQIAVIAPSLAAAGWWSAGSNAAPPEDARPVRLLLPSVALDDQLVRSTGRYLQGAFFAQTFHAPSASGVGRELADAFQQRYRRTPDAYAASAFDAFQLIRTTVQQGATTREGVRDGLSRLRLETAAASGGVGPNREPVRGTRVLTLEGAAFATP
ncbi:MAG: penicillin-binding protein activator [Myxococcota bacterium]